MTETLKQRAVHEAKEMLILTAYLYVTLGAVIFMKTALLRDVGVSFTPWGVAIVKALVLAKFMLLGNAFNIGRYRNQQHALIWPTLYKAICYVILLAILTILEEIIVGLFHHRAVSASLAEFTGSGLEVFIASMVIMFIVLVPYTAFGVLSEVMGDGKLEQLFFANRTPQPTGQQV